MMLRALAALLKSRRATGNGVPAGLVGARVGGVLLGGVVIGVGPGPAVLIGPLMVVVLLIGLMIGLAPVPAALMVTGLAMFELLPIDSSPALVSVTGPLPRAVLTLASISPEMVNDPVNGLAVVIWRS